MIQYGFERLVLLGSAGYLRAELPLDASVSLIAPNNTGKTSLINALQFLLIIDRKHMDFGAHDFDKSRRFYFPNNSAYILLEACLPDTGTVVLGCVGKGVSYEYQYFAYQGALDLDDYRLEDGRLVAEPQLVNHLATRGRSVFTYALANDFRDALYGARKKRTASEPDFTLFHLEHQGDAKAYRQVLIQTLRLDKLTSSHVKTHLLEIFKRDLSDAAIDFRQEWEKAFSEVNRDRAQYLAAVNHSSQIKNLAEEVEKRLSLRGKIIVWRPQIEDGLRQWQAYYEQNADMLETQVEQCQTAQRQLIDKDRELTKQKIEKTRWLDELFGLNKQQAELDCRFTLLEGRAQIESHLTDVQERLEAQITRLGLVKGRSMDAIRRDLQDRQRRLVNLRQQKETLADNLYRRLSEGLSKDELSRLNRGLQSGVMRLGPGSFDLDLAQLKQKLAQCPAETLALSGLQADVSGLAPQFQQMSEAELDEQIQDTDKEITSLIEQLHTAEQLAEAEKCKHRLEEEKQQLLQELADYDRWQSLLATRDERAEKQTDLESELNQIQRQQDASKEQNQRLLDELNSLRQQHALLARQHDRIVSSRNQREDQVPMFHYLKDQPHHPWLGESSWLLETLDDRLQEYQSDCRKLQTLERTLQQGLMELHAGGLTKYEDSQSQDEEWSRILDFNQMLPKEAEALEKQARSAVTNVTASLKQLKQGLDAIKARMRGFNRLVSQRQLSDLKVFKIEPRDEQHLVEAIDIMLNTAAQLNSGESFDLFNQESVLDDYQLDRARQTLFEEGNARQGLKVADLFRLEFVIGKQDQSEESFTEIDCAASNGTVLMAKLVTGLAMLHLMQHKAKRIRTLCYLDEALALDTRNQKNLIDTAEEFGFALICASPAPLTTVRYCVPIHHHEGKNHINWHSKQVIEPKGTKS